MADVWGGSWGTSWSASWGGDAVVLIKGDVRPSDAAVAGLSLTDRVVSAVTPGDAAVSNVDPSDLTH